MHDIAEHYETNISEKYTLCVEKILTVDSLRCAQDSVSQFLIKNGVLDNGRLNTVARWLLSNKTIYKIENADTCTPTSAET